MKSLQINVHVHDGSGPHEDKRDGDEESTKNQIMLDAIVSFSVANVSPHRIGKTVGTVFQAKQHANVKGSQIEPSKDLKVILMQLRYYSLLSSPHYRRNIASYKFF